MQFKYKKAKYKAIIILLIYYTLLGLSNMYNPIFYLLITKVEDLFATLFYI